MGDQAATLRRIMQNRGSAGERPERAPRAIFVCGIGDREGRGALVASLGACLARQGRRVLLVDAEGTLREIFGAGDGVLKLRDGLWLGSSSLGAHESPAELALVCSCGVPQNSRPYLVHEAVLVNNPSTDSTEDVQSLVNGLRQAGLNKAQVIVNQVTDGRRAQAAFQKLNEVAGRSRGLELSYLGHWQADEKVMRAVMKRKFLLNLGMEESTASRASLELLAKRLRTGCLNSFDGAVACGRPIRTVGEVKA